MDDCEKFFSAEALQLLQGVDYGSSPSTYSLFHTVAIPPLPYLSPLETNAHALSAGHTPHGCSPPSAEDISLPEPKRARFSEERREAVTQVRRQGACLRCRVMKISVSRV